MNGKQYQKGSDVFRKQLRKVPKRLTPQQILDAFDRLFDRIEGPPEDLQGLSVLEVAQKLGDEHPICAYGYARTYMSVLAGRVSREKLRELLLTPRP